MNKHFFTFRKVVNGQPSPLYIEVIVAQSVTQKEAREIAEQEVAEWRAGLAALRRFSQRTDRDVRSLPDYRFVGVN